MKEENVRLLKDTLMSHQGNHPLNFIIYEMQEEIKVNLSARKQKVQISSELLHQLDENQVLYKLN